MWGIVDFTLFFKTAQSVQTCTIFIFEKAATCSYLLKQQLAAMCSYVGQVSASGCQVAA